MDDLLKKKTKEWSITDSEKLYNLEQWGQNYFSISDDGNITILPDQKSDGPSIDLSEVIQEIKSQNISFPVLVRFQDLLRSQVIKLNTTFNKVIKEAEYKGNYFGVYPIKVNQMREVVEEIIDAGNDYQYGIEAGSKPELLAALALNDNTDSLTILNGFKDQDYLRLALIGRKLNRKIIIVIEKYSELIETYRLAREMKIEPLIGLRAKLSSRGSGRWEASGGDKAKFGLTIPELLKAIDFLKTNNKDHWVKLFHFHIGSQITDIRTIKDAISEGARIYCELKKLNPHIEYLDVGGGLGIDYDGSKSTQDCSSNYSMHEYIEDVVYIIKQTCDVEKIEHPNIVSESGRAITALHSCVIMEVFDHISTLNYNFPIDKIDSEHILIKNIRDLWSELTIDNFQETYNDAQQLKEEIIQGFKLGVINLQERGVAETLFWKICNKVNILIENIDFVPEELKELKLSLAEQYLCNASFFQSIPDSWAIGQLFPIMPITRLTQKPEVLCTLADITCDSDGKIDKFIEPFSNFGVIPFHTLKKGQNYPIGIFLTGAYQDVIGDMHNLFGKLNEVHIFSDDDDPNDFYIEEVLQGHTCENVLSDMQYNTDYMAVVVKKAIDKEVHKGNLSPRDGVKLTDFYEGCLKSYTYLKK